MSNIEPKKKVLIIEAHSDDSVISIGGFLDKFRDQYEYHFVLIAVSGFNHYHSGFLSREKRIEEYRMYVNHFDGIWHHNDVLPIDAELCLDIYPKKKLVSQIEKVLLDIQPTVVIFQGPSFHQDHLAVYEAVIAASRPTLKYRVSEMYVMENPTYFHSGGPATDFIPNLFIELTQEEMDKKLECYRTCFPSQIRDDDSCLSENGLIKWARYRGLGARCEYAEALRTHIRII